MGEHIDLWGKYLAEELPAIYGEQAAAVVVFVSAEYAARDWARLERRAALIKAVRERREYVLPGRFDDTLLPGLAPDMVVVDLRTRTPQQFVAMIAAKLAALGITGRSDMAQVRGPARDLGVARPAGRFGWERRTRGGWACTRRSACPGCQTRACRSTWRGTWIVAGQISGPRCVGRRRAGRLRAAGRRVLGREDRCGFEAVRALLPEWWLVHPAGPAGVAALAQAPSPADGGVAG